MLLAHTLFVSSHRILFNVKDVQRHIARKYKLPNEETKIKCQKGMSFVTCQANACVNQRTCRLVALQIDSTIRWSFLQIYSIKEWNILSISNRKAISVQYNIKMEFLWFSMKNRIGRKYLLWDHHSWSSTEPCGISGCTIDYTGFIDNGLGNEWCTARTSTWIEVLLLEILF